MTVSYAERIERIPPYLFAKIDAAIAEKKSQGVDVISLGVGDPDLPTPKNIVAALNQAAKDPVNHQYPNYDGLSSFRKAVADWYLSRFSVELNPKNEVLTLIGSKEGIGHTPLAFINRGDVVLYTDPGYPVYNIATILADGNPVPVPLLEENDFLPDLEAIPRDILKKAKLFFLNYPNNPTAATADKGFFAEVVEFARENDIIICHDAPYTELSFDGYEAPSFMEVDGAKDVGVEFHSLSKTYNMTGWRLGFVVGNPDVISGIGKVKQNIDSGAFNAVQYAGIEALSGPQDKAKKNVKIFQERRDVLVSGLKAIGWDVPTPKATFYVWAKIPTDEKSIPFAKKILDEAGVVVTPGVGFGDSGEGYVRFSFTVEKERIEEAVERIEKAGII
ncbi:MAG: LL-diaminopimelate aminotransferase [Candidatus Altiarchaeota archaeon]